MHKLLIMMVFPLAMVMSGCFPSVPPAGEALVPPPSANQSPKAYIDSISPSEPAAGDSISFVGHGTDADGTVVAYRWLSSIDGQLSTEASFESTNLSAGEHTISFKVQDNNDAWSDEATALVMVEEITPEEPFVINDFSADPSEIEQGDSTTLSWEVSGAISVNIEPGIGDVDSSGSYVVAPTETTTYTLTAVGDGSTQTATLTIITTAPEELAILFFVADPPTFESGGSSTLSWSTEGATTVTIDQGIGDVDTEGSTDISLLGEQTLTYTLTASDGTDTITASVTVSSYLLMPNSYEVTLSAIVSESGYVRSNGKVTPKYIYAGDDTNNIALQGFMSFDISSLPADAMIGSVILDLSDHDSFYGKPFSALGCLRLHIDDYGTLDGSDYSPLILLKRSIASWCSIDEIVPAANSNLKNAVQDRIGQTRLQLRIQFNTSTNGDSKNDLVRWSSDHLPKITIHYYSYD